MCTTEWKNYACFCEALNTSSLINNHLSQQKQGEINISLKQASEEENKKNVLLKASTLNWKSLN